MTTKKEYLGYNITYKNWPEKLNKFKDLIYCPLALPPVPEIDIEKFLSWSKENTIDQNNKIVDAGNVSFKTASAQTEEATGSLPWYYSYVKNTKLQEGWFHNFDTEFPELVSYIESFPFKKIGMALFVIQHEDIPVFLHVDPDEGLGMRFYLNNAMDQSLYFNKAWVRSEERLMAWKRDANGKLQQQDWDKFVNVNDKIYAKHPINNHAWTLTNIRAAHGIDTLPGDKPFGSKITCLIFGERNFEDQLNPSYDTDKLYDLLERSVEQYSDYAIWY